MSERGRPSARDIIGVPSVPPAAVTAVGLRLRSALRRASDAVAPPPAIVLEALFGVLDHRVLVVLCGLGVPDALDRPRRVHELAERVGADPVRLERLIRFASVRGWVRMDRRGRVRPTAVTRFLRADHPGGWRAWVDFAGGDEIGAAIRALDGREDAGDAFAATNGAAFFEWMTAHPARNAVFDEAMAAGARMHALTLLAAVDWSTTTSICDVGGGTGHLLATMLDLLPEASGTVLDLAPVVARAVTHPRLRTVAGDAFQEVPDGYDTYLLVNVLHDWSDEGAVALLARVADAVGDGRVLVVDNDHPAVPLDRLATGVDVLMATLTDGGRERDASQVAALAVEAGLTLVAATRLASSDWAYELRSMELSPPRR